MEQVASERTDGSRMPVQLAIIGQDYTKKLLRSVLVEDTFDQTLDFTYQDFLSYLHKSIRTKVN